MIHQYRAIDCHHGVPKEELFSFFIPLEGGDDYLEVFMGNASHETFRQQVMEYAGYQQEAKEKQRLAVLKASGWFAVVGILCFLYVFIKGFSEIF